MEEKKPREYRFEGKIIDEETGDVVVSCSTYLSKISYAGECESVEMETGSMLRAFEQKLREQHEEQFVVEKEEEEESN